MAAPSTLGHPPLPAALAAQQTETQGCPAGHGSNHPSHSPQLALDNNGQAYVQIM